MSIGKRYGPGEGYSARRGGERIDDDDVEGHALVNKSGSLDPGSRSSDMSDTIQPEGIKGARASDDDVEGHAFRPKATEPEGIKGARASDDDVEGHANRPK
jgi:hypothetical protein